MEEPLDTRTALSPAFILAEVGWESKKGLRAMTMKERLDVHRQIEAENDRKLKKWKEEQK